MIAETPRWRPRIAHPRIAHPPIAHQCPPTACTSATALVWRLTVFWI